MHNSKKKSADNLVKLPKPMKIKKEKLEEDRSLQSIAHYIDDRLEMIKQIFATLKPKTITNLAPDFIKKKSMEHIEELCLNELLCISTKRLLSIINATKCPTDTESSSDSDVEHKEEHISLEEISSDSEIEGTSTAAKKRAGTKNFTKTNKKITSQQNENDGQISVLELLELQARARAIRSQLALEPVTKIEVNSDDESEAENAKNSTKDRKKVERKRKSSESSTSRSPSNNTASTSNKKSKSSDTPTNAENGVMRTTTTKIKLKRNFRTNARDIIVESEENIKETTDNEKETNNSNEKKTEKNSRSGSPDVIPIVAEPETLLISDSSDIDDDKMQNNDKQTKNNETNNAKTMNINEQATISVCTEVEEGELSESETEKSNKDDEDKSISKHNVTNVETNTDKVDNNENNVLEDSVDANSVTNTVETETQAQTDVLDTNAKSNVLTTAVAVAETQQDVDHMTHMTVENSDNVSQSTKEAENINLDDDDDQNDDIISIEGGDLESEMIEHLEEDIKPQISYTYESNKDVEHILEDSQKDLDIISLESSEDEREKESEQSWHSRYVQSSKVSKVLAASRLGKRVRDRIKISKHSKKASAQEADDAAKSKSTFKSKHEDGSVEQYKELIEMRQRKT